MLTLFWPLRVFCPWFLKEPDFFQPYAAGGALETTYPPVDTKPKDDFEKILKAYKDWRREHSDKGYVEFIKAQQGADLSESSTWEIREELRRLGRENPPPGEPPFLRWHLILHLAWETETQRREADRMLEDLREKKSPLQGLFEGEEAESVFKDLPHFHSDPLISEAHWERIVNAWTGLFGRNTADGDVLVTFDRSLLNVLMDEIEPASLAGDVRPDPPIRFRVPDLSGYSLKEIEHIRKERMAGETLPVLERLISEMGGDVRGGASSLEKTAHEIETSCPWDITKQALEVSIKTFRSRKDVMSAGEKRAFSGIIGRTVVVLEETA